MSEPVKMNLQGIVQPWFERYQWTLAYRCFSIYQELAWKSTSKEAEDEWATMALEDRQDWLAAAGMVVITLMQAVNGELNPVASA